MVKRTIDSHRHRGLEGVRAGSRSPHHQRAPQLTGRTVPTYGIASVLFGCAGQLVAVFFVGVLRITRSEFPDNHFVYSIRIKNQRFTDDRTNETNSEHYDVTRLTQKERNSMPAVSQQNNVLVT